MPFEGLTGNESCPDDNGRDVKVFKITKTSKHPYFMPGADPGEGYANTNVQLFGTGSPPRPPVATMTGFVTSFASAITYDQRSKRSVLAGTTPASIMGIFPPSALPVLSGLARGFAVCDHWYSSVPTETMPNRAFACAATSQGHMDDATSSFTVQSIFGLMTAHNLSWKIYGYDAEPLTRANFPDTQNAPDTNFGKFADFKADCSNGTLPRLQLPGAELGLGRQQPAPELRRRARRGAHPAGVRSRPRRAGLEPDAAAHHLRRARRPV